MALKIYWYTRNNHKVIQVKNFLKLDRFQCFNHIILLSENQTILNYTIFSNLLGQKCGCNEKCFDQLIFKNIIIHHSNTNVIIIISGDFVHLIIINWFRSDSMNNIWFKSPNYPHPSHTTPGSDNSGWCQRSVTFLGLLF